MISLPPPPLSLSLFWSLSPMATTATSTIVSLEACPPGLTAEVAFSQLPSEYLPSGTEVRRLSVAVQSGCMVNHSQSRR